MVGMGRVYHGDPSNLSSGSSSTSASVTISTSVKETVNGTHDFKAEDAVALLLKHSRGYSALDEDGIRHETEDEPQGSHHNNSRRKQKKPKKTLGPERPTFFTPQSDNDTWVPPKVNLAMDAHH